MYFWPVKRNALYLLLGLGLNCPLLFAQLEEIVPLPKEVAESSGLAFDGETLWTHNDSGNEDIIYGIDPSVGTVKTKIYPKGTYNEDWEDLAYLRKGVVFIADIGNNNFNRKQLKIYGFNLSDDPNPETQTLIINFPPEFTSKKGKIQLDFEALVQIDDYFYLFSKTRKNKFEELTRVFQVRSVPGEQQAVYCGTISLCKKDKNCKITGAAFHQGSDRLALLSHKNVWIIDNFDPQQLDVVQSKRLEFNKETQKEGITFIDANTVYISEERNKGKQRLYKLSFQDD